MKIKGYFVIKKNGKDEISNNETEFKIRRNQVKYIQRLSPELPINNIYLSHQCTFVSNGNNEHVYLRKSQALKMSLLFFICISKV